MKTTLYTILCTTIRLGTVLMAVNAFAGVPYALMRWSNGTYQAGDVTAIFVGSAILLLIAGALWLFPGVLARPAVSLSSNQTFESPFEPSQWLHIALAVLGAWFVITALGGIFGDLLKWLLTDRDPSIDPGELNRWHWATIASFTVQIVLGTATALGSRGMAGLFFRLRHAGLASATSEEPLSPSIEKETT